MPVLETAVSIYGVLDTIFGGGTDPGYSLGGGRWMPGDMQARLETVKSKAELHGLLASDYSADKVYAILTEEGVWQTKIDNYFTEVSIAKKTNPTSLGQSNYYNTPATPNVDSYGNVPSSKPLTANNDTTINIPVDYSKFLLIGGLGLAVFFLFKH